MPLTVWKTRVHSFVLNMTRTPAQFISFDGAALKMDPTKINVAEFWKSEGLSASSCVAQATEKGKNHQKVLVRVQRGVLENKGSSACGTAACLCPKTKTVPVIGAGQSRMVQQKGTHQRNGGSHHHHF